MIRLAVLLMLLLPGVALAAPPANDAPGGAVDFETYGASNLPQGTPADERQALIDLSEATADPGVPRCLGAGSFARTVWLKVPASETAQRVAVEVSSPSGGTSEIPDVALYVGGQHKRAQSCDGAAVGDLATSAAAVEAVVPRGKPLLVQVGRSGGQMEQRVIASLRAAAIKHAPRTPRGDIAHRAPRLRFATLRRVRLSGATLTAEDPAQPACPAPATVWRKTLVEAPGRYRTKVRGTAAGSVTTFVGRRPTAGNAVACENRRRPRSALVTVVRVKRPSLIWTRIGADRRGRVKALVKRLGG